MNNLSTITLCLGVVLGFCPISGWAEARLHTTMSAKSFYVGEEFTYEILISGAKKVEADEPENSDALRVRFVGKISIPQSDPKKLPNFALRYRMLPMSPGVVSIPLFSINADGEELMTGEDAFIEVGVPESFPGLSLTRTLPTRDLYVGESVQVDYVWKSPLTLSGFRAIQLNLPLFYDPQFKVQSIHEWIVGNDKAAIGLPVSNTRLIARYAHIEENGMLLNTVSFSKILTPLKAGEMLIPKATLLTSYVDPPQSQKRHRGWRTNYPSYFNNNFFDQEEGDAYKKYYVATRRQTVRVLPLPEAGKPHDFHGAVGKRTVKVTARPKVVAAGDPITLTVEVTVQGFPEVVRLPDLSEQVAFSRQFVIPGKQSRGRIDGKKKTYILTMRPRAQDVTVIPPVRLPYFDPVSQSYGVAESDPIPITVKAAESATAFDAEVSGAGPIRNLLTQNNDGIRANFSTMNTKHLAGVSRQGWLVILLAFPPLAFGVFLFVTARGRLMRNDPVRARAKWARRRFVKSIKRLRASDLSSDPDAAIQQLDHVVRSYFSDKLNLVRYAHTYEELKCALASSSLTVVESDWRALQQIYESAERGAFCNRGESNASTDPAMLIELAQKTILTLDQRR